MNPLTEGVFLAWLILTAVYMTTTLMHFGIMR
jgi:hypothetical protein